MYCLGNSLFTWSIIWVVKSSRGIYRVLYLPPFFVGNCIFMYRDSRLICSVVSSSISEGLAPV